MQMERSERAVGHGGRRPLLVVTGAASGIGRATAEGALAAGYRVAAVDLDARGLGELRNGAPPGDLRTGELDASDPEVTARWVAQLCREEGAPAALVNSVGLKQGTSLEDTDLATWNRILAVDLTSVFLWTRCVGLEMVAAGRGAIVSMASVAARSPSPSGAAYAAAKAGVASLMRSVAAEWGRYGIRANSVSPGFIDTPMNADAYAEPGARGRRESMVPLRGLGRPADVAAVALHLCSEGARYVTGQDILVDGGLSVAQLLAV